MTEIEIAISAGLKSCFDKYREMTGFWLSHAPEYFITVSLAEEIFSQTESSVYTDASLKRIYEFRKSLGESPIRGRPPAYLSNRPDISVWYKTQSRLKAAIEIKRAYYLRPIKEDVRRLRRIVGTEYGPKVGYVVGYSENKTRGFDGVNHLLSDRFDRWADETHTKIIVKELGAESDDDGWRHGWCVLRVD